MCTTKKNIVYRNTHLNQTKWQVGGAHRRKFYYRVFRRRSLIFGLLICDKASKNTRYDSPMLIQG